MNEFIGIFVVLLAVGCAAYLVWRNWAEIVASFRRTANNVARADEIEAGDLDQTRPKPTDPPIDLPVERRREISSVYQFLGGESARRAYEEAEANAPRPMPSDLSYKDKTHLSIDGESLQANFTFSGQVLEYTFDSKGEWFKFAGGAVASSGARFKAWVSLVPTSYNVDMYWDVTEYVAPGRHSLYIQSDRVGSCNVVMNHWVPPAAAQPR